MSRDYTPQLPDVFPQDDILVEDEQHTYQTFEGDSGSVLEQTEYVLNKAPVDTITSVTGIHNGRTVEFSKDIDYSLDSYIRDHRNTFTFFEDNGPYILDDSPDDSSVVVADESGDSYVENTDYEIFNPDGIESDSLRWIDGGSSPDDGEDFTVKYTVTFDDSVVKWDGTERTPDAGSVFYVSYRCESVISRYIDGAEEQLSSIEDELEAVVEGKFVDSAEGQELDEIGKIFGVLGKRSGRDDEQYRIYLKSVVQSFISRGTVNGIKLAVSAATEVPLEDITINEDFENNEYEVVVIPETPVDGNLLEQVAEIADPSGVNQSRTRFTPAPDEAIVNDTVEISISDFSISEDATVSDTAAFFNEGAFEDIFITETIEVDPNKFAASDQMSVTDATATNPNTFAASDQMSVTDATDSTRGSTNDVASSDDATAVQEAGVAWDENNWNEFDWATENN